MGGTTEGLPVLWPKGTWGFAETIGSSTRGGMVDSATAFLFPMDAQEKRRLQALTIVGIKGLSSTPIYCGFVEHLLIGLDVVAAARGSKVPSKMCRHSRTCKTMKTRKSGHDRGFPGGGSFDA